MEQSTVFKIGKYTDIIVMILTGIATIITACNGYLSSTDWGVVIIAFGGFIIALRNYLKDHHGVM